MIDLSMIPAGAVTRFAPSPTGRLHLGHVANGLWTWGIAARVGGTVILRVEDHDRGRSRPEYERGILDDLDWLGLEPDQASRRSLAEPRSPFRQSDNDARYRAAVASLEAQVYRCRCSRRQIAETVGPPSGGGERRYPGTCRGAGHPDDGRAGLRVALPDDPIEFTDLRLGPMRQVPARQCGDLLLRDVTGSWTYQFAVVVDDIAHGVELVIRGEDLVESTGRQILLARLLGRSRPPLFLHHPLILSPAGPKLSKRDGAAGIDELRAAGRTPAEVLGLAAQATGLIAEWRPVSAGQLGDLFR